MENPLQHIVLTDEQDQIENFKMQLQALVPNLYSFSFFFFDTPKLGQALKDFVKTELTSANYESEWYENPKGEILNEILTKDFSKKIAVWYFDQSPENAQLINNLNGKRDFLINNAQKLIIISTNDLYQSWFRDAYDFVSRTFGGIYRYHDVTQYFVNEIPQMPEREMKLARIKKEVEELKMLEINNEVGNRLFYLSSEAFHLSDFPLVLEILEIMEKINNDDAKGYVLSHKAATLSQLGNYDAALKYLKIEEKIWKDSKNFIMIGSNFGNHAVILKNRGKLNEAMVLHKKEEENFKKVNHKKGLAISYGNQAAILYSLRKYEEALILNKKEQKIYEELGDGNYNLGLTRSFSNQALSLIAQNKLNEAMFLLNKAEKTATQGNDKFGLAKIYASQGVILKSAGRIEESMNLHKFEEKIKLEIGDRKGLVNTLVEQALLLIEGLNQKQAGIDLLKKAIIMANEMQIQPEIDHIEEILKKYGNE